MNLTGLLIGHDTDGNALPVRNVELVYVKHYTKHEFGSKYGQPWDSLTDEDRQAIREKYKHDIWPHFYWSVESKPNV